VAGPAERVALLAQITQGVRGLMPAQLEAALLPKDTATFERRLEREARETQELLDEGRALVEAVERLVCALHRVPAELEEAVIAHAARRAASEPSTESE
jgi:hypothetical protein